MHHKLEMETHTQKKLLRLIKHQLEIYYTQELEEQ